MLHHGDCLEVMQGMDDNTIDSLVTDPPAGISFMGKEWDHHKGGRDPWIEWMTAIMSEAKRVMKPGAHGLVWAIPRTSHWTATALENAGFEVRDVVTHLFGTGFPKSQNIGKAIDKAAGKEREVVGVRDDFAKRANKRPSDREKMGKFADDLYQMGAITAPATPEAKQWDGWGTALKPASEHWILIRKPLSEKTIAKNVLKWGTGGINIDGCRVGYQSDSDKASATPQGIVTSKKPKDGYAKASGIDSERHEIERPTQLGRFPANLVLSGDAPEMLDEQSGNRPGFSGGGTTGAGFNNEYVNGESKDTDLPATYYKDKGGASRFFYCAKSSKSDRGEGNSHPTVKSTKLMEYLIRLVTPPKGIVLDPFMGSGSTGKAATKEGFEFVGIEREEDYYNIAKERVNYGS